MGTTAAYFRKKNEMNQVETRDILVSIFNELGYDYDVHKLSYDKLTDSAYCDIGVSNASELDEYGLPEGLFLSVNERLIPVDDHDFDWIGHDIDCAVSFEDVCKSQNMFLEITYRYLQRYTDDVLWLDTDLVYSKDDIEKIYQNKETTILWLSRRPDYLL
ncbi:MAG: hypothetical protein Q4F95_12770 [Oscillospiraceae bacterium]|nr:hypothetical protein [Oscillospiraceae bacterium]